MSVATCKRYLISFVVGVLATIFAQEVTSMLLVLAPPAGLSLGAALLAVAFSMLLFVPCLPVAAIITACIRQPVSARLPSWNRGIARQKYYYRGSCSLQFELAGPGKMDKGPRVSVV